jgi:hypothetical protein
MDGIIVTAVSLREGLEILKAIVVVAVIVYGISLFHVI